MALAINSGPTAGVAGSGSPHNVTFNNAAGTIMFDLVAFGGGAGDSISGATYNAVSMGASITSGLKAGVSTTQRAAIFKLASPATGSNTQATSYSTIGAEENEVAISFTGQDGTTPYVTLTAVTTATTALAMDFSTMSAGDIGLVMASVDSDALTSPTVTGGTELSRTTSAAFNGSTFWAAKVTVAGTVTLSWTSNHAGVMVGVIVKQAPQGTQNMLAWIIA